MGSRPRLWARPPPVQSRGRWPLSFQVRLSRHRFCLLFTLSVSSAAGLLMCGDRLSVLAVRWVAGLPCCHDALLLCA
jgi:hypothetical protein